VALGYFRRDPHGAGRVVRLPQPYSTRGAPENRRRHWCRHRPAARTRAGPGVPTHLPAPPPPPPPCPRGEATNALVADPEWGWWIIGYFFLGGIAAGAYVMSTIIDLVGNPEDRPLARIGYMIAVPFILICGIFLTLDLHRPERFWHMLFRSEVVHEAIAQGWPLSGAGWRTIIHAPLLKYWSPMSVGSWAITLFGLCSALSLLGSLWEGGRLERVFRLSWFGKLIALVGCFTGFFVAAYTGALLTATNQPIWSDTVLVAPLFLTSAASTGISTMLLIAVWRGVNPVSLERLERADLWALGLELLFFVLFLAS